MSGVCASGEKNNYALRGLLFVCHPNGGSVIIPEWFIQFKRGEPFLKAAMLMFPNSTFSKSGLAS